MKKVAIFMCVVAMVFCIGCGAKRPETVAKSVSSQVEATEPALEVKGQDLVLDPKDHIWKDVYEYREGDSYYILAVVRNINYETITVQGNVIFEDEAGNMVDTSDDYILSLKPHSVGILTFGTNCNFRKYVLNTYVDEAVNEEYFEDASADLEVDECINDEGIVFSMKNTGTRPIGLCTVRYILFDAYDNVCAYGYTFLDSTKPGQTVTSKAYRFDKKYKTAQTIIVTKTAYYDD